jgi:hypothetical protein
MTFEALLRSMTAATSQRTLRHRHQLPKVRRTITKIKRVALFTDRLVSDNDDVNKLLASIRKRTRDEVDAEDAAMHKSTAVASTSSTSVVKGNKTNNSNNDDDDYDAMMTKLRFEARGVRRQAVVAVVCLFL